MRIAGRLGLAGLALLLACGPGFAQGLPRPSGAGVPAAPRSETPPPAPGQAKSSLPTVRIGALLPLSGAAAWFGKEMRQGMELAIADLGRPRRPMPRADSPEALPDEDQKAAAAAERANEEALPRPGVTLALEVADVPSLNVKQAVEQFTRLAAMQVPVVFTASTTPTLAVYPLASSRDVLLIHQGLVTHRFPRASRVLLHTRPPTAARVDALIAFARERRIHRLAIVAGGDEFGKTVRAALSVRWPERGGALVHEESLTLDAPDLPARLHQLVRRVPEAVVLGFHGAELGDLAARLREAGYTGPLFLLDDDPAALLAGGVALQDAAVFTDAFVPERGSAGERFADAYAKKFGSPPSRYAANAYEAVTMVAEGIRVAREDNRGTPGGTRLRETLGGLRNLPSLYGGHVALRDDGTPSRPLALFTVDGGKLTFVRYIAPAGPSS
ncbi:MAG: ABC transporter substrate-binding protein [Candidatus Rokubacteria bacterium]|nr:ABC transporter substrate-binding protein [Candidatus Rokubacteria bacterium]